MPREFARSPRRIVVKVGSAVLARGGVLDSSAVARLAGDIGKCLSEQDRLSIILVSSGAVASGFHALGLEKTPRLIADKQAAAAVGQPRLMAEYATAFAKQRPARTVAQVLLTAEDIDHRARFLNARHTLERLMAGGVVPIVNENDSVSFAEIKLGDNDRLSSLVASLVGADLLVILSSVPGVYRAEPARKAAAPAIIPIIHSLSEALKHVSPDKSAVGTGGMATKVNAACDAAALGIGVVIADGAQGDIVQRVIDGEEVGTYFPPTTSAASHAARKKWIGFSARPKGSLRVDEGARRALLQKGASLLPSGLVSVQGVFDVGALVELCGPDGAPFARGLSSYAAADLTKLCGRKAREIERMLGEGGKYADEAVHRDDLVILKRTTDENGRG